MNSPRICIIGLKCYDHIADHPVPRYLGGIETQLATLARGLAADGCQVSLITFDHGQADAEEFDGVTVYKSHAPEAGLRFLRTLHPRSTGLWQAMRRADAEVYLQMGAGAETGQTALGCRLLPGPRRKFIYCLASDMDFGVQLHAGRWGMEGKTYQFGLRSSDRIISQTRQQKEGLLKATGLSSQVIPMAVVPPCQRESVSPAAGPPHVLWVGRINPGKRLEWLLEAAGQCPSVIFDVVGTPNQASDYCTTLMANAAKLPNVRVHGRASAETLASLYQQASLLCCTSELEGFPTTFLEAWSCGIPVVTTFDPDGVVARHSLGRVVADVPSLITQLSEVMGSPTLAARLSSAASGYYTKHHALGTVAQRFRQLCVEVTGALASSAPGASGQPAAEPRAGVLP